MAGHVDWTHGPAAFFRLPELRPGDEVEVEVLDVDMERERVSLSLKATQEDPWQKFAREVGVGEIVEGEVTKLVPFGAFVKVEDGIEGLVHISELADRHVEVPEAVVNVGDHVDVKVIDVDTVRRRVSLSLKQATEGEDGPEGYEDDARGVEHAYSSGGDDDVTTSGGTLAGAFADAGLLRDAAPSPEEMALAEATLPEEPQAEEPQAEAAEEPQAEAPAEPQPETPEEVPTPEAAEEAGEAADEEGDEEV